MVTKRVSVTIKEGKQRREKKQGKWEEGKNIMATERFSVTIVTC